MRTRFFRVVVALSSLLGAVGAFAPQPASATSIGGIVFTGTAAVPGGLYMPCITNKTVDPTTAPHTIWTGATKTKTTVNLPCHPRQSGWAFNSAAGLCVGLKVNLNKPGKPLVEGPACAIAAAGTLSGWCLASSGQGTGTATIGGHGLAFNVGWTTSAGGVLPFTGNVSKSGPFDGKLVGAVIVRPQPIPTGVPCVNAAAKAFDVLAGVVGFVDPTL